MRQKSDRVVDKKKLQKNLLEVKPVTIVKKKTIVHWSKKNKCTPRKTVLEPVTLKHICNIHKRLAYEIVYELHENALASGRDSLEELFPS